MNTEVHIRLDQNADVIEAWAIIPHGSTEADTLNLIATVIGRAKPRHYVDDCGIAGLEEMYARDGDTITLQNQEKYKVEATGRMITLTSYDNEATRLFGFRTMPKRKTKRKVKG